MGYNNMIEEIVKFLKENRLLVLMIVAYYLLMTTKETFTSTGGPAFSFEKEIEKITARISDKKSQLAEQSAKIAPKIEEWKKLKRDYLSKEKDVKDAYKTYTKALANKDALTNDYKKAYQNSKKEIDKLQGRYVD